MEVDIVDIVKKVKETNRENYNNNVRTCMGDPDIISLIEVFRLAPSKGDICEVGVWRGGVGIILGEMFKDQDIYLFDTFEGIPFSNEKYDNFHKIGDFGKNTPWGEADYGEVKNTLSIYKNIQVYKGIFPKDNSNIIANKRFSIVHLDVDVYDSYKACLDFFSTRMVKDGLIILDDYNMSSCQGATISVDEFCSERKIIVKNHCDRQSYLQFS